MDPATFIAQMEPLAVFNRLDLASSNGSTCGEQRITYALTNNPTPPVSNPITGEFTLIFEARYPNPMQDPVNMMNGMIPTNTLADCQPLADFWLSVAQMTSDMTGRWRFPNFSLWVQRLTVCFSRQLLL